MSENWMKNYETFFISDNIQCEIIKEPAIFSISFLSRLILEKYPGFPRSLWISVQTRSPRGQHRSWYNEFSTTRSATSKTLTEMDLRERLIIAVAEEWQIARDSWNSPSIRSFSFRPDTIWRRNTTSIVSAIFCKRFKSVYLNKR